MGGVSPCVVNHVVGDVVGQLRVRKSDSICTSQIGLRIWMIGTEQIQTNQPNRSQYPMPSK